MKLEDFQLVKLTLHGSDIAEYGWFDGDMEDIRSAVALVDESWTQYFVNPKNIYFTGVAEWYEKIGYRTFLSECFGVNQLG